MGVLNVTPDSFSDGGLHLAHEQAVEHALAMLADGAWCIDIGGESTRPGAQPVSQAEELDRVVGVIERLREETAAPISVDTSKPAVMQAAARAGAGLLNDVRALALPGALETAAGLRLPVCLMHMQGEPGTMQAAPAYGDVVGEVRDFLLQRVAACVAAGIPREDIIIDPGFGFGKTLLHNQQLLHHLDVLVDTGLPVLVGLSRKSMIPAIMAGHRPDWTDRGARSRTGGSIALALYAATKGAHIVRVHDVRETVEALTSWAELAGGKV
ncbi:MAG: dihydropteroate synthase [Gammaproteobacteria bacterium]|jgi:dihydropteroate synthase|nr:dihydropteroate synthase [Gammaproteobacteria bacterium]